VAAGQSLTFLNDDAGHTVFHTITACRAPCGRTTGIAYPLADGPVDFDSGELGFGPAGFTPAANRDTWSTPPNLSAGTYTYFCRIHPFMRGSFRVARQPRS
jgi:plastocyanin